MTNYWNRVRDFVARFKDLSLMGIANIATSAISGLFWLYLASLIGTTEYGEISYFLGIATIGSYVSLLGAGTTIIVYTAKGEKIQSTLYCLVLIASIISAAVLFVILHDLGSSLFVVGSVIFTLSVSELLGRKSYKTYAKYLIAQKVLMIILALSFHHLIGHDGIILGMALSLFPFLNVIYKGFRGAKIDFSILKPKKGFITNSYVLDLSRVFNGYTDKLIIAPLFGFALLGNYQLGIQFLSLLNILPMVVYQYVLPHDASGDYNKRLKLVTIFASVIFAALGIILAPVILPPLFPKFIEAILILQIISVGVIPSTINLMYTSKFLGRENVKVMLGGSGVYLTVQILSIIVLGNIYGINGVAAAVVIAFSAETVYLTITNRLIYKKPV
jgi:O-antigen/teichoic acid export membrane protein